MLEYIKIYKNFYKTAELSQLVNDCDISMYTLKNFDKHYNCISKLNAIKQWCEENGITTLNEYIKILNDHISNIKHIFEDERLIVPQINTGVDAKQMFVSLEAGRKYLSIDLRHAYSQYIDSLNIFKERFDDIIFNGLPDFIKESKKARILMYFQIPDTSAIKYNVISLFDKVLQSDHDLIKCINKYELKPVSYNIDELIYDITDCEQDFNQFVGEHTINSIDVKTNVFEQHYITYFDPIKNKEVTIPVKEYTDHTNFVTNQCIYMNQLYKAYYSLPLTDYDLYVPNVSNWIKYSKLDEPIKILEIK